MTHRRTAEPTSSAVAATQQASSTEPSSPTISHPSCRSQAQALAVAVCGSNVAGAYNADSSGFEMSARNIKSNGGDCANALDMGENAGMQAAAQASQEVTADGTAPSSGLISSLCAEAVPAILAENCGGGRCD